jgi:hypothetical protein
MISKIYLTVVLALMSFVIGFLAQRSRMCFVAGVRDYVLVRDKELIFGLFSFIVTIWILTSLFYSLNFLRKGMPEYGAVVVRQSVEQINYSLHRLTSLGDAIKGSRSAAIAGGHFSPANTFLFVTFGGGIIMGVVLTFSGGCVLRQHVLLAQGNIDALYFIIGFYSAVVVYYSLLLRYFVRLY